MPKLVMKISLLLSVSIFSATGMANTTGEDASYILDLVTSVQKSNSGSCKLSPQDYDKMEEAKKKLNLLIQRSNAAIDHCAKAAIDQTADNDGNATVESIATQCKRVTVESEGCVIEAINKGFNRLQKIVDGCNSLHSVGPTTNGKNPSAQ